MSHSDHFNPLHPASIDWTHVLRVVELVFSQPYAQAFLHDRVWDSESDLKSSIEGSDAYTRPLTESCVPMRAAPSAYALAISLVACLWLSPSAVAQQPSQPVPDSALPNAPGAEPESASPTLVLSKPVHMESAESAGPLTLGDRFRLEVHTSLGIPAFLVPAGDALVDMADPPDHYPREWRDGGGAF